MCHAVGMDTITIPKSNQVCIVIGGREVTHCLLNLAARLALRGPLLLLDCGNRANPYPIAKELRRLTPDPLLASARPPVGRFLRTAHLRRNASRNCWPVLGGSS